MHPIVRVIVGVVTGIIVAFIVIAGVDVAGMMMMVPKGTDMRNPEAVQSTWT